MDFTTKTNNLITKINNFTGTRKEHVELLKDVCDLFDQATSIDEFNEQTISLLYYASNLVGVPHYFDLFIKLKNLENFDQFNNISLFGSMVREANLYVDKETKVHLFQKELIDMFSHNEKNRYMISAPTSFGKTFIIYHLIEKMKYKNVVLIFPTISLLSENLKRIIELKSNGYLSTYDILTLSEEEIGAKGNILIFTPERFMTFLDKNPQVNYDFMFFDEIYKIDDNFNAANIEIDTNSNFRSNREISFRIALELGIRRTKDALLAGPFLEYDRTETMINFINDNKFKIVDYNDIELVIKNKADYKELKKKPFKDKNFTNLKAKNKTERIVNILKSLNEDETIVYCSTRRWAEDYALKVSKYNIYNVQPNERLKKLLNHLENNFTDEWCLVKTLKKGIAIHHGTIPKYVQLEIIDLFNKGVIKCIFSTTTITEGVNTTAKNMIINSHKKGDKELKKFDVLNIMGRAGRFSKHFSGRVFILDDKLKSIINSEDDTITHKNYGVETIKDEVDIEITKEEYLSSRDIESKNEIERRYNEHNIPENIRKSFLSVSPKEKVELYKQIKHIIKTNADFFPNLIHSINIKRISTKNLQTLMNVIESVLVKEDKLFGLVTNKPDKVSVLTSMLQHYRMQGLGGLLSFELKRGANIDTAVRKVFNIVYNIFRYELVKYISVIDLIYKTITSINESKSIDDIQGFGALLSFLEYGAYSEKGRKASDLGLPTNVIKHIDGDKVILDEYEQLIYDELKYLL